MYVFACGFCGVIFIFCHLRERSSLEVQAGGLQRNQQARISKCALEIFLSCSKTIVPCRRHEKAAGSLRALSLRALPLPAGVPFCGLIPSIPRSIFLPCRFREVLLLPATDQLQLFFCAGSASLSSTRVASSQMMREGMPPGRGRQQQHRATRRLSYRLVLVGDVLVGGGCRA